MKFRNEFKYTNRFGNPERTWTVHGRWGVVHFHVLDLGERADRRYSGGLEVHYREPPKYMDDCPPSHDHCWALQAPCWHDGTSMYAHETVIPYWLVAPEDYERMFRFLEGEYRKRFDEAGEWLNP